MHLTYNLVFSKEKLISLKVLIGIKVVTLHLFKVYFDAVFGSAKCKSYCALFSVRWCSV
jgi:hypothetical protein